MSPSGDVLAWWRYPFAGSTVVRCWVRAGWYGRPGQLRQRWWCRPRGQSSSAPTCNASKDARGSNASTPTPRAARACAVGRSQCPSTSDPANRQDRHADMSTLGDIRLRVEHPQITQRLGDLMRDHDVVGGLSDRKPSAPQVEERTLPVPDHSGVVAHAALPSDRRPSLGTQQPSSPRSQPSFRRGCGPVRHGLVGTSGPYGACAAVDDRTRVSASAADLPSPSRAASCLGSVVVGTNPVASRLLPALLPGFHPFGCRRRSARCRAGLRVVIPRLRNY